MIGPRVQVIISSNIRAGSQEEGEEGEAVSVVAVPGISMTGAEGGSLTTTLKLPGNGEARLLVRFLLFITGKCSALL